MPFPRLVTRVPSTVGKVEITLHDPNGVSTSAFATITGQILDQNGAILDSVTHSLMAELSTAEKTALWNLIVSSRTKFTTQVLPR